MVRTNVSYWALGGRHHRKTFGNRSSTVHYPGTPQGRHPGEAGEGLLEFPDRVPVPEIATQPADQGPAQTSAGESNALAGDGQGGYLALMGGTGVG